MDNNNIQTGLANINAKADIKAEVKVADSVHNQFGGTSNIDKSQNQVINQTFQITVLQGIDPTNAVIKAISLGNDNANVVGSEVQKLLSDNGITEAQVQEKLSSPEILYNTNI